MLSSLMWGVTGLSIIGTVLNIKKKNACFIIWIFTNGCWCLYDLYIKNYSQGVLFFIYFVLAVWGILSWRKNK